MELVVSLSSSPQVPSDSLTLCAEHVCSPGAGEEEQDEGRHRRHLLVSPRDVGWLPFGPST